MTILEFALNNNDYSKDLFTRSTYHSNAIEGNGPREIYRHLTTKKL